MNVRANNIPTAYRFAVAARALAAVAVAIGILMVGYSAPVERVYAADPEPQAAAYDNGPTGYFPDLFRTVSFAAEPGESAPTF